MPPIEIIGIPQSNFVWAARIAAGEKGVPHVSTPLPPGHPDLAGLHPLGRIPVLRQGELVLAESRAIMAFIDQAFDGPALMPRDPRAAARAEQWVSLIVTAAEPVLIRQHLFAYLFPGTADGRPDPGRVEATLPGLERHLAWLDAALEGGFAGGQAFTLADAYLVPILHWLRGLPLAGARMAAARHLVPYLDRMMARPAVAATVPPPLPG
ncbi:glutathione S-transferase family protein [Falsiroseomonas ponticola]|uniref:glutathione S-transferase family protein n=1 Tax=Falsiroseomonas ponticola TaxID=2786951 RepID=UPI0019342A2A|nr:glutathione S-transferase family protein [Roseomonas ponticola]